MGFLLIGLAMLAMKLGEIDPVAGWSWLWILLPFGLAVLWWGFSDAVGLTRMREMAKMDERKAERRSKALEALGIDARRERRVHKARELARRVAAQSPPAPPTAPVPLDSPSEGAPPKQDTPRF